MNVEHQQPGVSEQLEFRYDLTYADLVASWKYLRKHRPDGRFKTRTRPGFLLVFPALLIGLLIHEFWKRQGEQVGQDPAAAIARVGGGPTFLQEYGPLLTIVSVIVLWVFFVRRRNRRRLAADPELKNRRCVLTRESALFGSEKIASGIRWDGFTRVVLTEHYLYFFIDTQLLILPLRAVGGQVPRTLVMIRKCLPEKFMDEFGDLVASWQPVEKP